MHTLQVNIANPLGLIHQETSYLVLLSALEGQMGVLPNHMPTITSLSFGRIALFDNRDNLINAFYIDGGVAKIDEQSVNILCYQCCEAKNMQINDIVNKIALLKRLTTKPSKLNFYEKVLANLQQL
jgi:F-type H+-transporting ATPase subunit epsilon